MGVKRVTRPHLVLDLVLLSFIGILLAAAIAVTMVILYRSYYSPSAFVQEYVDTLNSGRAADALQLPGVTLSSETLEEVHIPANISDALLRQDALAYLDDVTVTKEERNDDGYDVTISYIAAGTPATSTFSIVRDGWNGIAPRWRFETSPLASISVTILGADDFTINGFPLNRQQIMAGYPDDNPQEPMPMLVFTPGIYSIDIDTPISTSAGVRVLTDVPLTSTPVSIQTEPTVEFRHIVQEQVENFLTTCATQQVLNPTGCPFGYRVVDQLAELPKWFIITQPSISIEPDGDQWAIVETDAVARIEVKTRSLFDGYEQLLIDDVPFRVNGTIQILPDQSASIRVGSPDL